MLQGVAFTGVQVLREKRLISLHEKRIRRTAKVKLRPPLCRPLKHSMKSAISLSELRALLPLIVLPLKTPAICFTADEINTHGHSMPASRGHHPRGTTLREALRGNLPLRGLYGGLSECSAGSLRGFCGVSAGFRGGPRDFPRFSWPRGSMGVERYGRIPRSAANNLGRIPTNWELILKSFSGEGTLWESSLLVSLTLWDTPVLCTPPQFSGGSDPMFVNLGNCWSSVKRRSFWASLSNSLLFWESLFRFQS